MNLSITNHSGYTLAETEGHFDESVRDIFREQLHPIVGERGSKLIIDLSSSTRINSQGLGHLVTLVVHANTNGSRVLLCCVPPFLAMVFSASKLDTFFQILPTVEDAVAGLGEPQSA
jgi:anti-anti-sigma factor